MKSFPNIEKSGFHPGEYVGYANSRVWRIRKVAGADRWRATAQSMDVEPSYAVFYADTIGAISDRLRILAAKP